jgi:uncharacterized protein YjbI with pentapeptide repeats
VIDIDELKHTLKDHYIFVTGRRNGKRADLTGQSLINLNFDGVNLQSIVARMTDFSECSFVDANLSHADLFAVKLENANLKN